MSESRRLFLEEISKTLDYWIREGSAALVDPSSDLTWVEDPSAFKVFRELAAERRDLECSMQSVLSEILRGLTVSILTVIDGGTELAETMTFDLYDQEQNDLGELHDAFVMHLFETGRIN